MQKYQTTTVSVPGPSSGNARYCRWGEVRVYDATAPGYAGQGRGRYRRTAYESGRVDTRYDGPRSAYGRALREAQAIADQRNR